MNVTDEDREALQAFLEARIAEWDFQMREHGPSPEPLSDFLTDTILSSDEFMRIARGAESEWEYGYAADEQSRYWYPTMEIAEEFIGDPRQFRRRKAGPWEEANQ